MFIHTQDNQTIFLPGACHFCLEQISGEPIVIFFADYSHDNVYCMLDATLVKEITQDGVVLMEGRIKED